MAPASGCPAMTAQVGEVGAFGEARFGRPGADDHPGRRQPPGAQRLQGEGGVVEGAKPGVVTTSTGASSMAARSAIVRPAGS